MELNEIKSSSLNWGEAASSLNQNFSKIGSDMEKMKYATTRNKGYFSSGDALKSTVESAVLGDIAYVKSEVYTPYELWEWTSSGWVATGKSGGNESVNLGDYYTKEDTDKKLSDTSEEISVLRTDTDAKLSELGSKRSYYVLEWDTDAGTTRKQVPFNARRRGVVVVYVNSEGSLIKEQYDSTSSPSDLNWANDSKWRPQCKYDIGDYSLFVGLGKSKSIEVFATRKEARTKALEISGSQYVTISYLLGDSFVRETFAYKNSKKDYFLDDRYWKNELEAEDIFESVHEDMPITQRNLVNYIKKVNRTVKYNDKLVFRELSISLTEDEYFLNAVISRIVEGKYQNVAEVADYVIDENSEEVVLTASNTFGYDITLKIDGKRIVDEGVTITYTPSVRYILNAQQGDEIFFSAAKFIDISSNIYTTKSSILDRDGVLFNAIKNLELYYLEYNKDWCYTLDYIFKERVSNDWGNGVKFSKRNTSDLSIIETVDLKYTLASSEQKKELNKISNGGIQTIRLEILDVELVVTLNTDILNDKGQYSPYSILPQCMYKKSKVENQQGEYSNTLYEISHSVGLKAVGQQLVYVKKKTDTGTNENFNPNSINENVIFINKGIGKIKGEVEKVQIEDSVGRKMMVSSFGYRYMYLVSPYTEGLDNGEIALVSYDDNCIYAKIVLSDIEEGQYSSGFCTNIFELSDGCLLLEIANGELVNPSYRTRRMYKTTKSVGDMIVNNGEIFINAADLQFKFELEPRTKINDKSNINIKGSNVVIAPYGSGRTAVIYYSNDNMNTVKLIFNGGIDGTRTDNTRNLFVDTKPNSQGGLGEYGGHPLASTTIPQVDVEDLWNIPDGSNNNIHVHSVSYDEYYDRIWACTGDASNNTNSYTAVWYTDDFGVTWHYHDLRTQHDPYAERTQFLNIIPLRDCVLFSTDGDASGIWRYNRAGKNDDLALEYVYMPIDNIYYLGMLGAGVYCNDGLAYISMVGNTAAKSNQVIVSDGYNFKVIYIDEDDIDYYLSWWAPIYVCRNKLYIAGRSLRGGNYPTSHDIGGFAAISL